MSDDIIIDDKEKVDSILWFLHHLNQGFKKNFDSSGYYYFIDDNEVIAIDDEQITPIITGVPYEKKYSRKDDFIEFFKGKLVMMRTFNEDEYDDDKMSFYDFYNKKNDNKVKRKDIMSRIIYNHDKGLFRIETEDGEFYETIVDKDKYRDDMELLKNFRKSIDDVIIFKMPIDYDQFQEMKDLRDDANIYINLDSKKLTFKKPLDENFLLVKFNYRYFSKFTKKGKGYVALYFTDLDNDIYTIEINIEIRNRYKYSQFFNVVDF